MTLLWERHLLPNNLIAVFGLKTGSYQALFEKGPSFLEFRVEDFR